MRTRLLATVLAVIAAGGGVLVLRQHAGVERRAAGSSANAAVPPARPAAAPASSRQWRRAWTYPAGAPLTGAPASLGNGWVVTTGKGRVAALDGNGRELWSRSFTNMAFAGSAAVAGAVVVVADGDGRVVGLEAASGRTLWEKTVPGALRHGPLAVRTGDSWSVVVLDSEAGVLRCLDPKDGREIWHSEKTNRTDGQAASDGRLMAYGNCDAAVYLFDATNGVSLGSGQVGAEAQMAGGVLMLDGRVYGGTRAGELVCVDAETQTLAWHVPVSRGEAFATPVAARGLVVMGTAEGKVAAYDGKSGAARWSVSLSNAVSGLCVMDDAVFAVAGGGLQGLRLLDGGRFAALPIGDDVAGPACNGRAVSVADDGGTVIVVAGE